MRRLDRAVIIASASAFVLGAVAVMVLKTCGRREEFMDGVESHLVSMARSNGLAFDLNSPNHFEAMIEALQNIHPNSVAVTNTDGVTFIPAMGTIPRPLQLSMAHPLTTTSFPDNWNEAAQYFSYCRNQQNCGSCWAFATTETLENRINFLTKGGWRDLALKNGDKTGGWLSPQYIISCLRDSNEKGCQGAGILEEVIRHLTLDHKHGQGIFLAKDYPYIEDTNGEDNEGANCDKPANKPRFNFQNYYAVSDPNAPKNKAGLATQIARIKQELMTYGPMMTSMYVWDTFMEITAKNNTPSTPYSVDEMGKDKMVGGHAVHLVGWGTIPGKDPTNYKNQYWILRNSWGGQWCHDGYWYWRMGDDLQGLMSGENIMIEFECVAGQPDMSHPMIQAAMASSGGGSTDWSRWLYGGLAALVVAAAIGIGVYYFGRGKIVF